VPQLIPAGGMVLEIGSGTGYLPLSLAPSRPDLSFIGVDPLPNYVELATQRAQQQGVSDRVRFVEGFAETLSGTDDTQYDAVLSDDTLHHVQHQDRTCLALADVCRPGALGLAIEPSISNPCVVARHSVERGGRNFHPNRFSVLAQSNGWREIGRRHVFGIPPAIKAPKAG
jgi:ubiquinone/menaquinone biosynthesis C-methylase UbiE